MTASRIIVGLLGEVKMGDGVGIVLFSTAYKGARVRHG